MNPTVTLWTGGGDRPYALGLALSLAEAGVQLDFIGSDFLESAELRAHPNIGVLNLRGDVRPDVSALKKLARVLRYYVRLFRYSLRAEAPVFHILWNNRFELFDRTLLMLFYRALGKKIVLTVHNVNIRARDGRDNWLNRATLRFQYHACAHLFVHTEQMKSQLQKEFDVPADRITVIPFGINNTVPDTALDRDAARERLGLEKTDQVLLFFGNIAPYKGLQYLVDAAERLLASMPRLRLVIAGRPKGEEAYWGGLEARISSSALRERTVLRIEYVADEDTEIFFKAADAVVLPYTHIFQSGVLFLAYNFGVPVIASDVGSMREDIIEGETGYICKPSDGESLAETIRTFFDADLYHQASERRQRIRDFAHERYSWTKVACLTSGVYDALVGHARSTPSGVLGRGG
jgi:glycosyltransferase involved in cell wall biosynthesis